MVESPLRLGYVAENYPLLFSCHTPLRLCGSDIELAKVRKLANS